MKPGRIVLIIIGSLLVLAGLTAGAGAAAFGLLAAAQRGEGYLSVPEETYSVSSYALTSESIEVGPGVDAEDNVGRVQVRGTAPEGELFIGIASEADVNRYLAGVAHSELGNVRFEPFSAEYEEIPGTAAPSPPGDQDFWAASSAGAGTQELDWPLEQGEWTIVVMNPDAAPQVTADLQVGVRSDLLGPLTWWLVIGAVVLVLGGVALILAGILTGRRSAAPVDSPGAAAAAVLSDARRAQLTAGGNGTAYPARLYLIAAAALLFTGRYPRPLFDFIMGLRRWSYRVLTYAALMRDDYPPFRLDQGPVDSRDLPAVQGTAGSG